MLNLEDVITTLTQELHYHVVELTISPSRGGKRATLYIYKEGGVGLDDCSTVASSINLQLEALHPDLALDLQVSTPGIDRQFKANHEYTIFMHHQIEGTKKDSTQFSGEITDVKEDGFYLDQSTFIAFADVSKAKLKTDF
ncbi:ribosome maturation factor RimP [Entomospira culicis]|uniref:Ribosome maturation factor RimP n=1 Tax=Entomospira culicis TaxID=2719989 RepID=A0A968GFH6_9SPIO|nr:hypothetical protein [Entomospira culicis]NIZ18843.1 hypothetical protein [Entomospira culicis]NIZ69058.1 hypothetical protein [Entomospira culicis]WDI37646.1 hypothetical protein PVA46_02360 [Entomospira culicis]WDI39274.1 hypothetical protein PVA47_02365 [Entomospira culicis]